MPYAEGPGYVAPTGLTSTLVRRRRYATPLRRRGTTGENVPVSVERAIALAPGIRPDVIRGLYARGVTIREGLVPGGTGGYYDPATREIHLRNAPGTNRVVPSTVNPTGFSQTGFGSRGNIEHELRHAAQHLFPASIAQATNPLYVIGRGALLFSERALKGNKFGAIPYMPAMALGGGAAVEQFANYGESAYGTPRLPLNTYAPFHTNVRSNKSLVAEVERLNAAAMYYGG